MTHQSPRLAESLATVLELIGSDVNIARAVSSVRGAATTEAASPAADPDDLQPARAIRRALADGRLSAGNVRYGCALELGADDQGRALAALRRGLGRFSESTRLETASDPVADCLAFLGDSPTSVAVALVIGPGGDSIALAFGRP